jgi:hypothetical protein
MSRSKRGRSTKMRSVGKVRPKAASAAAVIQSEQIRNRRGCWNCCAGRAGPPSPASCNRPAGSSTRCAVFLPGWYARSSASRLNPTRRKASATRYADDFVVGFEHEGRRSPFLGRTAREAVPAQEAYAHARFCDHDSGSMRIATPSPWWTLTTDFLPVSRRSTNSHVSCVACCSGPYREGEEP